MWSVERLIEFSSMVQLRPLTQPCCEFHQITGVLHSTATASINQK